MRRERMLQSGTINRCIRTVPIHTFVVVRENERYCFEEYILPSIVDPAAPILIQHSLICIRSNLITAHQLERYKRDFIRILRPFERACGKITGC